MPRDHGINGSRDPPDQPEFLAKGGFRRSLEQKPRDVCQTSVDHRDPVSGMIQQGDVRAGSEARAQIGPARKTRGGVREPSAGQQVTRRSVLEPTAAVLRARGKLTFAIARDDRPTAREDEVSRPEGIGAIAGDVAGADSVRA